MAPPGRISSHRPGFIDARGGMWYLVRLAGSVALPEVAMASGMYCSATAPQSNATASSKKLMRQREGGREAAPGALEEEGR